MAKPKKYPEVMGLAVGEFTTLCPSATFEDAREKVAGYGRRSNRKFLVACAPGCPVVVRRLPDPVTDTELPGAQ